MLFEFKFFSFNICFSYGSVCIGCSNISHALYDTSAPKPQSNEEHGQWIEQQDHEA